MGKPKPAFQMYPAEFYSDTACLSQAELGALCRIMCQYWRNDGPIPDDETLRGWALGDITEKMRPHIVRELAKLDTLRGEYEALSEIRGRAGRLGGRGHKAKGKHLQSKTRAKEVEVRVEVSAQDRKEHAHEAELEPTFTQWFDLYDKRKAQGECRVKWRTLGQQVHEAIMEHTARLVATTPKEFRKDPIRYLSKQGWEDEVIYRTATNGQPKTDEQRNAESRDALAKHFANRRSSDAGAGGGA